MTFVTSGVDAPAPTALSTTTSSDRLRALGHAVADLRLGFPCVVVPNDGPRLAVAAIETVTEAGLDELLSIAPGGAAPELLLAPGRAPNPTGPLHAYALEGVAIDPAALRGLADPTAPQRVVLANLQPLPAPAGLQAALALAKKARLLPALLAVPLAETVSAGRLACVDEATLTEAGPGRAADIERVAEAAVPMAAAPDSRVVAFRDANDGVEHFAVLIGHPERVAAPLVRIHSECFTGDLLGSLRCDCGPQLEGAIQRMAGEGAGALLYLAQEGRGIGLVNKLRAYALQDQGLDTLDANRALGWGADERDYGIAAAMLRGLGLLRVRLLTNNPRKIGALTRAGISVERTSHLVASNGINDAYLAAKTARFGHLAE
jgi:GTP cyclohydrolase II